MSLLSLSFCNRKRVTNLMCINDNVPFQCGVTQLCAKNWLPTIVTHAGIAASVDRAFTCVCLFVCLFVVVRALKGKRLELSTSNLVHVYSIAVLGMHWPRGQKVKGQGHTVRKPSRRTVASDYSRYPVTLCCATCCRWRRGTVGRHVGTLFIYLTSYTDRNDNNTNATK